jgi:hypothetical protein
MFGPSQLYRNNGNGTFTEVTEQALGATSFGTCGAKAFDFNNDGKLDIFLADMHSDLWTGQKYKHLGFRPEDVLYGNTLFENVGGGRFREVSGRANVETFWAWGIATGDFDNDGYEDAFLPSGMGYPFHWPNQLRMNNGDGTFTERA